MEIAVENKNRLNDLYDDGILPDLEPASDVVQIIEDYRQLILSFIQDSMNSEFAKHFPLPKDRLPKLEDLGLQSDADYGRSLIDVKPNEPSMVRNVKALNNAVLIIERLYPILNQPSRTEMLKGLSALAPDIYNVLGQFDPQMNQYTRAMLGYIRAAYSEDFKHFESLLPELTQFSKDAKKRWGDNVYKPLKMMLEKVDTILINPPEFSEDVGNKDLLEKLVVELYPDFEKHINDKNENGLYNVTNKDDTNTVRLIKAITNTLELHSKLLMQDTSNKTMFQIVLDAINSGAMIQEQLWSIECSAAIREQAGNGMKIISGELTKTLKVIREFVVEVDHAEEELNLKEGYLFDQIKPWLETFLRLSEQAGVELTEADKNLFAISRKAAREQRYVALRQKLQVTDELKEYVTRLKTILSTSTPVQDLKHDDLLFLSDNLELLNLPEDLYQYIKQTADYAISCQEEEYDDALLRLNSYIERARNYVGNRVSEQSQVQYAATQFENSVVTDRNDLKLQTTVLEQIDRDLTRANLGQKIDYQDVRERALEIHNKRFSMQYAVQKFREELISNINRHCDDTIVFNLKNSMTKDGFYSVGQKDSTDLCNLKFILNTLHRLDKVFDAYENRSPIEYYQELRAHGYAVYQALDQLKLDSNAYLGKYHLVSNLIFSTKSELGGLYTQLLDEASSIFLLKPGESAPAHAEGEEPDYLKMTEDFASEWIETIKDFAAEKEEVEEQSVQEDYEWLATECRVVEERIFTFLESTFHDDLTKYLDRNQKDLFYNIAKDDPPLIKDAKHLLNAMHHFTRFAEARGTDTYNLKLPIWLHRINMFTRTLNKIDLAEAHDEIKDLYQLTLAMGQKVMNNVSDPVALNILARAEEIEAFGFKHGTFTRASQYAVEQYQIHCELVGLKIADDKKDGFLGQRIERRQQNIDHIEQCQKSLAKSIQILKKLQRLGNDIKAKKYRSMEPHHAKAILRHVDKLGFDAKQTDMFKAVLEGFAEPDQQNLSVSTKPDNIKLLVDRINACVEAVEAKQIELEHQKSILNSHQMKNKARLDKATEVRDYCALINKSIELAIDAVEKDDTAQYHKLMGEARAALVAAKSIEKDVKSLKANYAIKDAEYKIEEMEKAFNEYVAEKFTPLDEDDVKRKNPFAQVFNTPPKSFLDLIFRFFELIVVILKTIFDKPAGEQLKQGHKAAGLDKGQSSQAQGAGLRKHGMFARNVDVEDAILSQCAKEAEQMYQEEGPRIVPPAGG